MTKKTGHAIEIVQGTQAVKVDRNGIVLAETDRPVLLHETGCPTRYYFRPEDVRMDLLRPSETRTTCPFKGVASYWSAEVSDEVVDDIVWSYPDPIPEAEKIRGLLCFYNEKVDLEVSESLIGGPHNAAAGTSEVR